MGKDYSSQISQISQFSLRPVLPIEISHAFVSISQLDHQFGWNLDLDIIGNDQDEYIYRTHRDKIDLDTVCPCNVVYLSVYSILRFCLHKRICSLRLPMQHKLQILMTLDHVLCNQSFFRG